MLTKDNRTGGSMRNKPCVCGSGRKFKLCCWAEFNTTTQLTVLGLRDFFKRMRYMIMKNFRDTGVLLTAEQAAQRMECNSDLS